MPGSSRRLLGTAISVATAGLLAGCGGSSSGLRAKGSVPQPERGTPIASTTAAASPRSHLSARSQFVGFARAVNLRPRDVPGFVVKDHEHHRLHNKALEGGSEYRSCFNGSRNAKAVFKAASKGFEAASNGFTPATGFHFESTRSQVEIARSVATARRELATFRRVLGNRGALDCLRRAFDRLGTQSQSMRVGKATMRILLGNLQLAPLPTGSLTAGTDGGVGLSLGIDVTYIVTARGRTVTIPAPLHFDVLEVLVGRGEATLMTEALGPAFPAELEARLFSKLVSRAASARRQFPAVAG